MNNLELRGVIRMIIKKQGLIYCPNGARGWDKNTFMTPHAMPIDTDTIRIWEGGKG